MQQIHPLLHGLLQDYNDLTPQSIKRLDVPPSSIEMLRLIQAGRPIIIEGFNPCHLEQEHLSDSDDRDNQELNWNDPNNLIKLVYDQDVSIAITPNGRADSIQSHPPNSSSNYFVQPLTEKMKMGEFMNRLMNDQENEIVYLQSQNGNIYRHDYNPPTTTTTTTTTMNDFSIDNSNSESGIESDEFQQPELKELQKVFQKDVGFMTGALERGPDAVNLWVGNSKSVTSLHKDPYLNIYTLLSGSKTFTLLPPLYGYLLDMDFYPTATYTRSTDLSLSITPDQPNFSIPWTRTIPTELSVEDSPLRPIRVTVCVGETLYLPAGWWHYVEQEEGDGGICVAVNYWYDQTIDPEKYALERLVWRLMGRSDIVDGADDE